MSEFTQELAGFRNVRTFRGDTLQRIASRELNDAGRWYELININGLKPPYITDDLAQSGNGVLLSGSLIKIPSPNQVVSAETDPEAVFGTDVRLEKGDLGAVDGDLALVSGVDNLGQALRNVVKTEPGELVYHPRYGCSARRLIGEVNGPSNTFIAASFVKRSLQADPRVAKVSRTAVDVNGDSMNIEAEAVAVDGRKVYAEVNYGVSG